MQGHEQRIRGFFGGIFAVEKIDIVYVHALAAFLSTRLNYKDYSNDLWSLSRVEQAYDLIAKEIIRTGYQKRVMTICNGVIDFIDDIIKSLYRTHLVSCSCAISLSGV